MRISHVSQCFTMIPAWEAWALPLGDARSGRTLYSNLLKTLGHFQQIITSDAWAAARRKLM